MNAKKKNKYLSEQSTVILFWVFYISFFLMHTIGWNDTDGYWIIATGNKIRESGIMYENSMTIVPGLDIVVQQWGWCVLVSWLWNSLGHNGLLLLNITCAAGLLGLAYKFLSINNIDKKSNMLVSIIILIYYPYMNMRPETITIILLLAECICLDKYIASNNNKWLWWLPILTLIEINIHGSMWIMHFVLMLPYIVPMQFKYCTNYATKKNSLSLIMTMIPMILSLLLNPYGIDMILYLPYSMMSDINNIGIFELRNITLASQAGVCLITLLILYVTHIIHKSITSTSFWMCFGLFILCMTRMRNLMFIPILIVYLAKEILKEKEIKFTNISKKLSLVLVAYIILIGLNIIDINLKNLEFDAKYNDLQKVLADNMATSETHILTGFDTGAVMEFLGYRCYVDARPELYNTYISHSKKNIWTEYCKMNNDNYTESDMRKFLNDYDFEYAYITKGNDMMNAYLSTFDNWKIIYEHHDDKINAVLWKKANYEKDYCETIQ